MRYLFPNPIDRIVVNGKKKGELLYHVSIQIISTDGATAIGIMNRDSGVNEEKVEVMNSAEKRVVYNVSELVIQKDRDENKQGSSDWEPTLFKRGFEQIIADFIQSITLNKETQVSSNDALKTHEICDVVIKKLLEINK
nr:hypothetical protein [Bacillus sp. SA1-12]